MSTNEIFNLFNFHLLNEIMSKDPGVIECNSIPDAKDEVFNQPINLPCTKKKEQTEFSICFLQPSF